MSPKAGGETEGFQEDVHAKGAGGVGDGDEILLVDDGKGGGMEGVRDDATGMFDERKERVRPVDPAGFVRATELYAVGGAVDDAAGRVAAADSGQGFFDAGRGFEPVDEDVVALDEARGFHAGIIRRVQQERGVETDVDGAAQGFFDGRNGFPEGDGIQTPAKGPQLAQLHAGRGLAQADGIGEPDEGFGAEIEEVGGVEGPVEQLGVPELVAAGEARVEGRRIPAEGGQGGVGGGQVEMAVRERAEGGGHAAVGPFGVHGQRPDEGAGEDAQADREGFPGVLAVKPPRIDGGVLERGIADGVVGGPVIDHLHGMALRLQELLHGPALQEGPLVGNEMEGQDADIHGRPPWRRSSAVRRMQISRQVAVMPQANMYMIW